MQFIQREKVAAAFLSIKALTMLAPKVREIKICEMRMQPIVVIIKFSDPQMVSLTRSGSFMSSSSPRQQPFPRKTSIDGNGGGMSDDSMHEKYFKSVENTPETRRRNTSSVSSNPKHSSDSSPQSPISPQNNVSSWCQWSIFESDTNTTLLFQSVKATRPSILSSLAFIETPNSYLSSHKTDPVLLNLDLTAKPER